MARIRAPEGAQTALENPYCADPEHTDPAAVVCGLPSFIRFTSEFSPRDHPAHPPTGPSPASRRDRRPGRTRHRRLCDGRQLCWRQLALRRGPRRQERGRLRWLADMSQSSPKAGSRQKNTPAKARVFPAPKRRILFRSEHSTTPCSPPTSTISPIPYPQTPAWTPERAHYQA